MAKLIEKMEKDWNMYEKNVKKARREGISASNFRTPMP
jgi:hypothetical protein